jgi:predicted transcriptional regulator
LDLDHSNRTRVRVLVSLLPGLHLRQLQRILGLSFNSTRYHVEALTKTGEIVRTEEGGYSRLYPIGTSEYDRTVYSLIRGTSNRKILSCLQRGGSFSHKQLSDATNLAKSTISEHLARLIEVGVVRTNQGVDHSTTTYELTDLVRIREMLYASEGTIMKRAAKEFVDLWDF